MRLTERVMKRAARERCTQNDRAKRGGPSERQAESTFRSHRFIVARRRAFGNRPREVVYGPRGRHPGPRSSTPRSGIDRLRDVVVCLLGGGDLSGPQPVGARRFWDKLPCFSRARCKAEFRWRLDDECGRKRAPRFSVAKNRQAVPSSTPRAVGDAACQPERAPSPTVDRAPRRRRRRREDSSLRLGGRSP